MGLSQLELSGRTAVVIGGTSGLGLVIAKSLAQAGANVIPTGRRQELARAASSDIQQLGGHAFAASCDVTQQESLEALLRIACVQFGSVQILVNCAGRIGRKPTVDVSPAEWNEIIDTNLNGTLRACQVFGRHMIDRRFGRIINIASISSFVALHEVAAYCASKAAVAALTKSLAIEWACHRICVNALAPGVFRTQLNADLLDGTTRGQEFLMRTPMRRFGEPSELAGAAVFLASDAASFITGHVLPVDGGFLASGVNQ